MYFEKYLPYIDISVEDVEWSQVDSGGGEKRYHKIDNPFVYFERRNGEYILYMNCDDLNAKDKRDTLNYYYRMHAYEPITMHQYERQRLLRFRLHMKHKIYLKTYNNKNADNSFEMVMTLKIENRGFKDGSMVFDILDSNIQSMDLADIKINA